MDSKESLYKCIDDEEGKSTNCENATLHSASFSNCNQTEDELLRELAKILVEAYLGEQPYDTEKGSDILPGFDKRTS